MARDTLERVARPLTVNRACALHERAVRLRETARPRAASIAARQAATFFAADPAMRLDYANTLIELGASLRDLGDYRASLRATRRGAGLVAPRMRESLDARALYVNALVQVGDVLVARARYTEAERGFREALAHARPPLPRRFALPALNGLGVVCKYTGRFAEGLRHYRLAAEIARSARDRIAYATVLHNIAGIEHERGRYAEAEPTARKGLALRRRALGRTHPAVAADEAALAAILAGVGKNAEAAVLFRRALRTFARALGPKHVEVGLTLGGLGALEALRGQHARAERTLRRALPLQRATLGANHPETRETARRLALVVGMLRRAP